MINFFELWESAINKAPFLTLEITYSRITDWMVIIRNRSDGGTKQIVNVQECVYQEALAMAYVQLAYWLKENCDGY